MHYNNGNLIKFRALFGAIKNLCLVPNKNPLTRSGKEIKAQTGAV